MNAGVTVSHETARGCGYRKPGGLYLVADGPWRPCGRLPMPLDICPTCGNGIKFSRGWTWIDADALLGHITCTRPPEDCAGCSLSGRIGRAGLLWIGQEFYATPADWSREAQSRGVSRRIATVPRGFVAGQTLVLVAHKAGVRVPCDACRGRAMFDCPGCGDSGTPGFRLKPAIFGGFRPRAVQYVTKGTETEEELQSIAERGIELVKVVPVYEEQQEITA